MKNEKLTSEVKLIAVSDIEKPISRLIEREEMNENSELVISLKENGLLQPIIVKEISKEKYVIVSGIRRFDGHLIIGLECIHCIIISCENELDYAMAEIDENLLSENLTPLQLAKLLSEKNKIYLLKNPDSAKEDKSANNGKPKEKRKELPKSFKGVMAKGLNCSEKKISNAIKMYDNINGTSPELAQILLSIDKKSNLKGIEIEAISKMSDDEMFNLSETLLTNGKQKEKYSIRELMNHKSSKLSKQERFRVEFMFDLFNITKDNSQYQSINEKIDIDMETAKEIKLNSKNDFTNEINFILENI